MGNFHSIQVFRVVMKEFHKHGHYPNLYNSTPQLSIGIKAQLLALHLNRLQ